MVSDIFLHQYLGEQPDVELQEEEEAFQWSAYLKEKNATAVSKSLFRHVREN